MERSLRLKVKYLCITGLATTAALNTVQNKIPIVSDLVKNTNHGAKISNIDAKYFNKFNGEILNKKIKRNELVNKFNIFKFIDNSDLDKTQQHQQQK